MKEEALGSNRKGIDRYFDPEVVLYAHTLVQKLGFDSEVADEAVQNASLTILRNQESYSKKVEYKKTLSHLVIFRARDICRKKKSTLNWEMPFSQIADNKGIDKGKNPFANSLSTSDPYETLELEKCALLEDKALQIVMSKFEYEVFIMTKNEDMRPREIAEELEIDVRRVSAALYRANKKLKSEYKKVLESLYGESGNDRR